MDLERVETLCKLVAADPEDAFSRYALGLEYLEGEPGLAQQHFQEVLRRSPDYVAAYYQLGKVSAGLGQEEAARQAFEQGLQVASRLGDWHTHGELEDALAEL